MDSVKIQSDCNHNMVKWLGFWDGKDIKTGKPIGGPIARCKECNKELRLSWTEWNKIPEQNREGSDKIKKMEDNIRARSNKNSGN